MKIAALLLAILLSGGAAPAEVPQNIEALRAQALDLVNRERRERGLPSLELGPNLVEAAQGHASDMWKRGYYAHESPEGEVAQDRYIEAGGSRWEVVAENIARCADCNPPATTSAVERLHQGWMDSPPHRENILRPGLDTFGFGLAVSEDEGLYAVQTFAGPGVSRNLQPGEEAQPLLEEEQVARAITALNRARIRAGAPPLEASEALSAAARNLLPPEDEEAFSLTASGDLFGVLPEKERTAWLSVSVVAGACGGCGTAPVAADIRYFLAEWRDDPTYRTSLINPEATHGGFALQANGAGRKVAILVLGQRR